MYHTATPTCLEQSNNVIFFFVFISEAAWLYRESAYSINCIFVGAADCQSALPLINTASGTATVVPGALCLERESFQL